MSSTYIIYISGLGDRYDNFRRWALGYWKIWGVSAELVPITWYDGKDFEQKMKLVDNAIERAIDKRIVLVGESAGATLALHASLRHANVARVITLCGVTQPSTPISLHLQRKAPALLQAARSLPRSYNVDIHSIRARIDGVVNKRWSTAAGATTHVLWTVGHLITIASCLTVLSRFVVGIAKK